MMESLEKLGSLDVKLVCPGHGAPFSDMKRALSKSKKRIEKYMSDKERIGDDLLKKIIVYTLLMKRIVEAETFFTYLMSTCWFKETVDLYFNSEYQLKYNEIINSFIQRDIIRHENQQFFTTVKP
jgi:hypothetical protein